MKPRKALQVAVTVALVFSVLGCTKAVTRENPTFASPDHKVLYELMAERCNALSMRSMERLSKIYVKDSAELEWIQKEVIPVLDRWPARYQINKLESIRILGVDAVGRFRIFVDNSYKYNTETVDVVYVKENAEWKIDYVVVSKG